MIKLQSRLVMDKQDSTIELYIHTPIIKCTHVIIHLPVLCFSPIFRKRVIYRIIRNGDLKVFDYFLMTFTFVVPELQDFILLKIVSCKHVKPLSSIFPFLIIFKLQQIIDIGGQTLYFLIIFALFIIELSDFSP